ncbi:Smr/MutS family protein [Cytophagaceae bacterium ABcell3]|nr:Smr/MutS family protein [Cytophagaceae bacterium ABcell3]
MDQFKTGSYVKITGQDTVAEVLKDKGKDLEIAIGPMKMTVKKNKVEPAENPEPTEEGLYPESKENVKNLVVNSGIDTKEKLMHFRFELDVRGKAKEEVMNELTVWVDDALLLGIKEAKVIHGRGNGVLRDTVHAVLKKYKEIEALKKEANDAVTVVKFRQNGEK